MTGALKTGLVPPGNINVSDSQGQQTLMAKGTVASTFSDYSGNVGSLYDLPASSSVVNQVTYLPTPGVSGVGPNLSNPDGIGIPRQAKYPAAAAKFTRVVHLGPEPVRLRRRQWTGQGHAWLLHPVPVDRPQ